MFTTKSSRVIRVAASAAVCVALALGTTGVAFAGQGSHSRGHSITSHDHGQWNGASGTVTAFTTTSITLKGHGGSNTYNTTGATYSVGKTAGSYSDLANGENVSLVLTSTTPQTVTSVTIYPEVFVGTVTGFDSTTGVISITGFHGTALTVDVTGTTTYTSGGAASSTAALVMGAKILAVGLPGTAADSLKATSVNIWASTGGGHGHSHGFVRGHGKSGHSRH